MFLGEIFGIRPIRGAFTLVEAPPSRSSSPAIPEPLEGPRFGLGACPKGQVGLPGYQGRSTRN